MRQTKRRTRLLRVTCPVCKRDIAGYVPSRGDGSVLRPRSHRHFGAPCEGHYRLIDVAEGR